ncbi:MAG: hypothetical protein LBP64_11385 [Tannerella sp.]|nr:hypothetical protein [Tannerella sp.]
MSKDWDKWPPDVNSRFDEMIRKQEMKKAQKDADIAKASGASLEWHVPTKEKAIELEKMFEKYDVEGIDIIVTPK